MNLQIATTGLKSWTFGKTYSTFCFLLMSEDEAQISVQAGSSSISGYIYKHLLVVAIENILDNITEKRLTRNE